MDVTAYTREADDYAAFRPPYAEEAVRALRELIGLDSSWLVADIGSGTGNVARNLVGRVTRVFAVEPDGAMRRQAEQLLGQKPAFVSIAGTAEATTLSDRSVDLITVGQAIHWFDADRAKREFLWILKPEGWLGLTWNRFGHDAEPDIGGLFLPDECRRLQFPMTMQETWPQFTGGARSAANTPCEGDDDYGRFERKQRKVFDPQAMDGTIDVEYTTELAVGQM